jgi:hypothetical protein
MIRKKEQQIMSNNENSVSDSYKLRISREYAEMLIMDGHVDADNNSFDGVRALYQVLHGLPATGKMCEAIREIEKKATNHE